MKNKELKIKAIKAALDVAFDETLNTNGEFFSVETTDGINVMQELAFNPQSELSIYENDMVIVTDWSDKCDAIFTNKMKEDGIECSHRYIDHNIREYYLA